MHPISKSKIETLIYVIRGRKVMFAHDLAELYGVETRTLNQAVRRNLTRFPSDFMFQLSEIEAKNLRSQIVMSSSNYGGQRHSPVAFTELGVAMLSSVLNSERAIQVNISIMRAFFELRRLLNETESLANKLEQIEKNSNQLFKVVFERLDQLETEPSKPRRGKIGF